MNISQTVTLNLKFSIADWFCSTLRFCSSLEKHSEKHVWVKYPTTGAGIRLSTYCGACTYFSSYQHISSKHQRRDMHCIFYLSYTYVGDTHSVILVRLPLSVGITSLLSYGWIYVLEQPDPDSVPYYGTAVVLYAIASVIYLICEPLYVISQLLLYAKLKVQFSVYHEYYEYCIPLVITFWTLWSWNAQVSLVKYV